MADKTESEVIAGLEHASDIHQVNDLCGAFSQLPEGYKVHSLEQYQHKPNRITADYSFRDTDSLAKYLNKFSTADTILFSCAKEGYIRAVVDHDGVGNPSHKSHKATFKSIFSDQYKEWRNRSDRPMGQTQAGLFLEERAIDIIQPDAASVMDIVMSFEAVKRVSFRQSTRLQNGSRQFTYVEDDEQTKGNITLPEKIKIRVPVFEGQEPDVIDILVRYNIDDGKLRFTFKIHQQEGIERLAFERCEDSLKSELDADLMMVGIT